MLHPLLSMTHELFASVLLCSRLGNHGTIEDEPKHLAFPAGGEGKVFGVHLKWCHDFLIENKMP